jgi:hypothetical protein
VVAPAAIAGLRALAVGGGALLAGDPSLGSLSTPRGWGAVSSGG